MDVVILVKHTYIYKKNALDSCEIFLNYTLSKDSTLELISKIKEETITNSNGQILEKKSYTIESGKSKYAGSSIYDNMGRIKIVDLGFMKVYSVYDDHNDFLNIKGSFAIFDYYNELGDVYLRKAFDKEGKLLSISVIDFCLLSDKPQTILYK